MSTSTDLAVATPEELLALQQSQEAEFDDSDGLFQTPILKIGQPLTREVQNDLAEAGEFINTLTGDGLGTKLGFIVSYYQRGRFASDKETNKAYVAFGTTIPEAWEPLVGEEFVGTPFDQYPDAEEVFKADVNAKRRDWGKGPVVSTTHNFTGLALVEVPGEEAEYDLQPVRLSLQRTNMPSVRKWMTLKRASMRNRPFWDKVFDLSTVKKEFTKGVAYNLEVRLGRDTTVEERQAAVELAQAVQAGRVTDNQAGDSAQDKAVEPDAKGGLEV